MNVTEARRKRAEHRLQRLIELRDHFCGGIAARLAKAIKRDPTYVTRMFYPPGKPGRKGIAYEIEHLIESTYHLPKGWFDMPLGDALPTSPKVLATSVQEPLPVPYVHSDPQIAAMVHIMEGLDTTGREKCLRIVRAALDLEAPPNRDFTERTGT